MKKSGSYPASVAYLGLVFQAWQIDAVFQSYRRMVGDGRMPAMRIIPPFNVGEESQPRFLMRTERSAIDQLTLKGGE